MAKTNKAIEYGKEKIFYSSNTGMILNNDIGYIYPLLKNGNSKVGKGVYTFSILPGMAEYSFTVDNGITKKELCTSGTCNVNCKGCYAQKGFFNMPNVKNTIAITTWLCQNDLDFVKRAIQAQIKADKIDTIRIHATGDFFSTEYITMWHDIASNNKTVKFWTYTKNPIAENAFNDLDNINIVKSIIPDIGFNFGHIDYIIDTYNKLKSKGAKVHICKCGIDKNQHCTNCRGCIDNTYVLFIEHSTEYKAEKDPLYNNIVELINNQ